MGAKPADLFSKCECCNVSFGWCSRKYLCMTCDSYMCAACYGVSLLSLGCCRSRFCQRCKDHTTNVGDFEACRGEMESGTSVTLLLPKTGLLGAISGSRRVDVWLALEINGEAL